MAKNRFPEGVELIQAGSCPAGAENPLACMFCSTGHMLECHFPMSCSEAQCGHHQAQVQLDLDPKSPEELMDEHAEFEYLIHCFNMGVLHVCVFCACNEVQPCPGGCGWSEKYLAQGLRVCTRCEPMADVMAINQSCLRLLESGRLQRPPEREAQA